MNLTANSVSGGLLGSLESEIGCLNHMSEPCNIETVSINRFVADQSGQINSSASGI